MTSSVKGSGFGPRPPPLLEYLQQILRGYSDGQILKELLQNAEDAGASEVCFLYDQREFGRTKLLHPELAKFQGPAVYAFNNAEFTEQDWEAIQRPARSDKKDDVMKVGRFGIGFSSVYHITDLPCIISGGRLAFIDPSEEYFTERNRPVPGFQYSLVDVVDRDDCSDQLSPFLEVLENKQNIRQERCLSGTLFRFPLRSDPSELSHNVYTPAETTRLLQAFQDDAGVVLLFLRNVEKVSVSRRDPISTASSFEVSVASSDIAHLRGQRNWFNEQIANHQANPNTTRDDIELSENFKITSNGVAQRWITVQKISYSASDGIGKLASSLHYLPWVGVAIRADTDTSSDQPVVGRIFCFLPLPPGEEGRSGLPVHVHGYFGVSDDRRSIKWPGSDQIQNPTAKWNRLLVEELLPGVYLTAVLESINLSKAEGLGPTCVYNALPDMSSDLGHWKRMAEVFYNLFFRHPVLYAETTRTWDCVSDVIIFDVATSDELTTLIVKCLQQGGNIIIESLPQHVLQAVKEFAISQARFVDETHVLSSIRNHSLSGYTSDERRLLIVYLLQEGCTSADLEGLELLYMKDGTFQSIVSNPSDQQRVFVPTDHFSEILLPHLSNRFVDGSLSQSLTRLGLIDRLPQIRYLDQETVVQLLHQTLPSLWSGTNQNYTNSLLDWVWLKRVWDFSYHQRNLRQLQGLHLLPVSVENAYPMRLKPLQPSSMIIQSDPSTENNFPHLTQVLRQLNVTICPLPTFITSHSDLFTSEFVRRFDAVSVISCLINIGRSPIERQCTRDMEACCRFLENLACFLRSKNLDTTEKDFLKQLQIYRAYSSLQSNVVVKLTSGIQLLNEHNMKNLPNVSFPQKVFYFSSSDVRSFFMKHLNVPSLTGNVMVKNILQHALNSGFTSTDKQTLVSWIGSHFSKIVRIDGVSVLLKRLRFIPNGTNQEKCAGELFDPSDSLLRQMYSDDGRFPSSTFLTQSVWKGILPQIGYRDRTRIDENEIISIANRIHSTRNVKQAQALSQFLFQTPNLLSSRLVKSLGNVSFIPCKTRRPLRYPVSIPFLGESSTSALRAPSELVQFSEENLQLAGSSVYFSEASVPIPFRGKTNPTPQEVCEHLRQMTTCSLGVADLSPMLHAVYKFLDSSATRFTLPVKWIWVGHKFAAPHEVCRQDAKFDLRPYLFNLPEEYMGYGNLFGSLRSTGAISTDYLLEVLGEIRDSLDVPNDNGSSLVDLSIRILKRLTDTEENLSSRSILVPTHDNRLLPPGDVTFCDYDWLIQHRSLDDYQQQTITFINDQISPKMAAILGVTPLRSRLVNAEEIEGIRQTGQYESITTRIRNILSETGYQSTSIPKEMIQNAEDAGATEVRFLIDLRTNENAKRRLLDDGMKSLQGPALWVYNDKVFSDTDLENITKLAGGSKGDDGSKIGQFGLGFNSVYHLTDVPSFVTRHFINVFDPHRRFLGAQIRNDGRGILIDFKKNPSCMKTFQDQFLPYHGIFGCDLLGSTPHAYNGTLFRLPLRTGDDATKSDICTDSWDEKKLKRLVGSLCETVGQMMLFTENVEKISVYLLGEGQSASEANSVFTAIKQMTKQTSSAPVPFRQAVFNSIQAQDMKLPADSVRDIQLDYMWTEEGRRYFDRPQAALQSSQEWIVVANSGYGKALSLCRERLCHGGSTLPCGGVAWERGGTLDGQVFCFLPLSIPRSKLPVHINASFALSDDRSSLWGSSESTLDSDADFKGRWNNALFEDVILKAYLRLLQVIHSRGMYNANDQAYFAAWPNPHDTPANGEYGRLVKSFYSAVARGVNDEPVPMFWHPHRKERLSIKNVAFVDDQIGNDPKIIGIVGGALKRLRNVQVVLKLPRYVIEGFREANCYDVVAERTYTLSKFLSCSLPHIDTFLEEHIDRILLLALDMCDSDIRSQLEANECIPTSSSKKRSYTKPSELFDPQTFGDLFSPEDGFYPSQTFLQSLNDRQKGTLRDMGCMKVDIDWGVLLERVNTIEALGERDVILAKRRSTIVLDILERKLSEVTSGNEGEKHRERFLKIPFLFGEDSNEKEHIRSPIELYPSSAREIVITERCIARHVPILVKRYLKLANKVPLPELVLQHMRNLRSHDCQNPQTERFVKSCCLESYRFLQSSHLTDDRVLLFLRAEDCFYLNKVFVPASKISIKGESVPPYIYKVNSDLDDFQELLHQAGVRDFLPNEYLIQTLRTISEDYQDTPLPVILLDGIVSNILRPLAANLTRMETDNSDKLRATGIYIPDVERRMGKSTDLSFCDVDWVDTHGIVRCHDDLALKQAIALGVKDVRQQLLDTFSDDVSLGEEFGQKEDLTRRLKRILTGYPCDVSILKEIIQNADDAGATNVHFVLDETTYSREKILGDSMGEVQGPALLAYNDKPFTDDDIAGIQKLGEGSKSLQADKTGRYGVGFNVVYHLTDCPMFMSAGDTLCIMDPTLRYVPGASVKSPCRKYRHVRTNIQRSYPDFYECFSSLNEALPLDKGTMFRFPLRTSESDISSKTWTTTSLQGLFDELKTELFDALLFLKSVQTVSISVKSNNGGLEQTYTVKSHLTADDKSERNEFFQALHLHSRTPLTEIPVTDSSNMVTLEDSEGNQEKWIVHQRLGLEDKNIRQSIKNEVKFNRMEMTLLPKGGVAARLPTANGRDREREVEYKAFCFLPLPITTDFRVHIDGYFALDHESRRNLWMGSAGDPKNDWNELIQRKVIAPAYLKLLLRMEDELNSTIAGSKLEYDAFLRLLDHYHNLFPTCDDLGRHIAAKSWNAVSESLYLQICAEGKTLFPVILPHSIIDVTWHSCMKETATFGYFGNLSEEIPSKESDQSQEIMPGWKILEQTLLKIEFPLLATPFHVYTSIMNALKMMGKHDKKDGVEDLVLRVTPADVLGFLRLIATKQSLRNLPLDLKKTPIVDTRTLMNLIEYVKKTPEFESKLDKVPLLLTRDSQLSLFRETAKTFHSRFGELLPSCEQKFLHQRMLHLFTEESKVFTEFGIEDLGRELGTFLDESMFRADDIVKWDRSEKRNCGLTPSWLRKFWKFVSHRRECYTGENFVQYVLQHLGCWTLLPVQAVLGNRTSESGHDIASHLIALNEGNSILAPEYDENDKEMYQLLVSLGCPVLDTNALRGIDYTKNTFIEEPSVTMTRYFVGHINTCRNVLSVLGRLLNRYYDKLLSLDESGRRCILRYFQRRVESLKKDGKACLLKELPCYETVDGRIVHLSERSIVIEVHDIPEDDQDKWMGHNQCILLKTGMIPCELYEVLGITTIDEVKMYRDFILPNFHTFSVPGVWAHLLKLQRMIESQPGEKKKEGLISQLSLRMVPLILNRVGDLKKANELYDPDVGVFRSMLPEADFPQELPKERSQLQWYPFLNFLRLIGLQTIVRPSQFLRFVKALQDGDMPNEVELGPNRRNIRRDEELFKCFCTSHELHTNTELLQTLPLVSFISPKAPPTKYHSLYKPPAADKVTIRAVPFHKLNLVWSTETMCPTWVSQDHNCPGDTPKVRCSSQIKDKIGILAEPTLKQVLQHAQTLCNTLGNQSEFGTKSVTGNPSLLCEVMLDIFKFCTGQCAKLRDKKRSEKTKSCTDVDDCCDYCKQIVDSLISVPVVPVNDGKVLTRADMLTKGWDADENDALSGYLEILPDEFIPAFNLLQCLGATNSPTVTQYANALGKISTSKEITANPNLIAAAAQAMSGFFKCLARHRNEQTTIEALRRLRTLYLMSQNQDQPLVLSSDLYYNDKPQFNKRLLRFPGLLLKKLGQDNAVKTSNDDELLKYLPEHLRPRFISDHVEEKMCSSIDDVQLDRCTCPVSNQLRRVLEWDQFPVAIRCIVAHEMKESDDNSIETAMAKLLESRLSLRCVKELETNLLFEGREIPHSHGHTPCLFEERTLPAGGSGVTVYISHKANLNRLYQTLAKKFIDHFNLVNDKSILVLILRAECEEEISNLLNDEGIGSGVLEKELFWRLPVMGENIPRDVTALLNQDPMFIYQEREFVGYDVGEGDEELLVYARVVKVVDALNPNLEPWQMQFEIDVGEHGTITVPGRKLFKFVSPPDPHQLALEPYNGPESNETSGDADAASFDEFEGLSLQDAKEKVSQTLREVRKLPEADRKKMLRRLMLRWHPDKHTVNKKFVEEIFKHIQNEIHRWGNREESRDFYEDINRRARRDHEERQQWERQFRGSNARESRGSYNSRERPPPSFGHRKDTLGARRYLRQAQVDYDVSRGMDTSELTCQWKCQLYFFAAEKAVRAAQLACGCQSYAEGGIISASVTLRGELDLTAVVGRLTRIVNKDSHYPAKISSGRIPKECFMESNVGEVEVLCSDIMEKVEDLINRQ